MQYCPAKASEILQNGIVLHIQVPGLASMGCIRSSDLGRAGFVIHPEKGRLGASTNADCSSASAASVCT